MSAWQNLRMKPKLLLVLLLVGLVPLALVGYVSLARSHDEMMKQEFAALKAVEDLKANYIAEYFRGCFEDTKFYATSEAVVQATQKLCDAFYSDAGVDGADWLKWDDLYGPELKRFTEIYALRDLYILSPQGDVVWSAKHNTDFGKNVAAGDLASSGLDQAYKKARSDFAFVDFQWYGPTDAPASFTAMPVKDRNGKLVGELVMQISLTHINKIMQDRTGMGKTGETYLVGADKRMRSDSYLDPDTHSVRASFMGTIRANGVNTQATRYALEGDSGTAVITDYKGLEVLSAYSPFELPGTRWAVIAEMELSEVQEASIALRREVIMIAAGIGIILIFFALWLAGGIAKPIRRIAYLAKSIAKGRLNDEVTIRQSDEIGELADAFRDMQSGLLDKAEAARKIAVGEVDVDITIASEEDILGQYMVDMREALKAKAEAAESIAGGDLDVRVKIAGEGDVLGNSMVVMVENLRKNDREIREAYARVETNMQEAERVVAEVNRVAEELKEGNLSAKVDSEGAEGTYLQLIESFNSAIANILEPIEESMYVLDEAARGNLSLRVNGDYKGDHARMKEALNNTLDSLNTLLLQVREAADQVTSGSQQVSNASQTLSQGATEQASSLEEVTSSVTEIEAQSQRNAESALEANKISKTAGEAVLDGNRQMKQMLEAMQTINESSQEISKIIKAIDEIAFQTNLLSLNAAVEAARAGVHGKGFAVVAEEVRNLAQRSAKAAKETAEMIAESIHRVDRGLTIAQDTAKALGEIEQGSERSNQLVEEIAALSSEQAKGVTLITESLGQIDQVTQSNSASAEESAAAAEELSGQASQLKDMIARFKLSENGTGSLALVNSHPDDIEYKGSRKRASQNNGGKSGPAKYEINPAEVISLDDHDFAEF